MMVQYILNRLRKQVSTWARCPQTRRNGCTLSNCLSNSFWYLWQLPQNLLGLALIHRFQRAGKIHLVVTPPDDIGKLTCFQPEARLGTKWELAAQANNIPGLAQRVTDWQLVLVKDVPNMGGISLGKYIICNRQQPAGLLIAHERGHQIQSRKLGLLYLIIVGIPSSLRALWQRKRHGNWTPAQREAWYHQGWPESAANAHGGVTAAQWIKLSGG